MHLTEGTGLAINCGDLALTMVTKTVLDDPTLESDGSCACSTSLPR